MEQVLGHVSHYLTLRAALDAQPAVDPHWVEVTYEGNGRLERMPGLPRPVSATARGFLQVREGVRRRALDVLFFHTSNPAVFQWDLLMRTPSVLSLDVTPRQYDALAAAYDHVPDRDDAIAGVKRWLNRRTYQLARHLVVWSTWVKESLVRDYGLPPERVSVIPPGVDLTVWQSTNRADRPAGSMPRVLFVGGDFERKGGRLLLDWFRRSGRELCEVDLVTRAELASEPGVRVHRGIRGNTPESRSLYAAADIFVLPSIGETFGIASVEAMAAGLPVVTTRVGGATDIVVDGHTGYLIQPDDPAGLAQALESLIRDPARRQGMGERGRARAEERFDGVSNAQRLLACLREAART
jgi:glycosyltransferase involved in cell wall biosynthesis